MMGDALAASCNGLDGLATPKDPVRSSAGGAARTTICFSHLRWDFVFQRPQHLMTRFAAVGPTVYWEEPVSAPEGAAPSLQIRDGGDGVTVVTPELSDAIQGEARTAALSALLDGFLAGRAPVRLRWYYTPMMLAFSRHIAAECTVYDCMDELANFRFAPPELAGLEAELFALADVVFTGGYSLYEAKRDRHANIHPFPSSVDRAHFAAARDIAAPTTNASAATGPRLGFYGVIDERMDLALLAAIADARPEWSLQIVGPVVKIDPADLPQRSNIHYLGGKSYAELPAQVGSWDVALMPFAINESTRFISPTKTPEYLAAGRPVVSTPIIDVVRHYGELEGVKIASTADGFVAACEEALVLAADSSGTWLAEVDQALAELSWDNVFARMHGLIDEVVQPKQGGSVVSIAQGRHYDYLIVGAGFAGSVMAERLAAGSGKRVLVVDRRPHVAGNAFDRHDDAGILIHQYGPHIFHTNSTEIFAYLSRFTKWRPYEHRVLADVDGTLVPMPINRTTLNLLYGLSLSTDEEAAEFLAARAEPVETIRTSADVVVAAVGRELYETFFQGYTRKQWGMDPSELDKSVTSRVPTRTNTDDRYFTDSFQAMPADGYTKMFEAMLDHPNIDLMLGVDYADIQDRISFDKLVFTGPIDEYFGHRYGRLPYRSLDFRHETIDQEQFQDVATVNYPAESVPYTRITEYKHLTGQTAPKTSITYEYPSGDGDPYYPIPRPENQALFKRYEALALGTPDVIFVGRLATYRYYNMDQVVGQALAAYRRLSERELAEGGASGAAVVAAE
jgi:UDP-galactopyranose mutase